MAEHVRTWMCWPCRTEVWGGPEGLLRAKQAFARVARAITTFEPVTMAVRPQDAAEVQLACANKVETFEVPLDDSWARDMGPTFLRGPDGSRAAVQWRFNAWGNKYQPYDEDAQFATVSRKRRVRACTTHLCLTKAARSIVTVRAHC